jgi:hypothetical protein
VATVAWIAMTPVKGLRLHTVEEAQLGFDGIAGDRAFFLVGEDGKMVSGTRLGPLVAVVPEHDVAAGTLSLRFPDDRVVEGQVELGAPEQVSFFGLKLDDARPVDGAFAAVGAMYRGGARQVATERSSPSEPRDERVWAFARRAIATIQSGHASDLLPMTADTSIMGDVDATPVEPVADQDLTVERVRDSRRVSWGQESGIAGEWWVTWLPPSQPRS